MGEGEDGGFEAGKARAKDVVEAPETEKTRELRFVGCPTYHYIWAQINEEAGSKSIGAEATQALGMMDPSQAKENLSLSDNVLRQEDVVRLPKGFTYKVATGQGVQEVSLEDIEAEHIDYRVTGVDYDYYVLNHEEDEGVPAELGRIFMPKYLVEDPEGVGDFEEMLTDLKEQQGVEWNKDLDVSSLKPIDWRSFVIQPAEAS